MKQLSEHIIIVLERLIHLFDFEIRKDMVNFLGSYDYFFMSDFRRFLLERCDLLRYKLLVFELLFFSPYFP